MSDLLFLDLRDELNKLFDGDGSSHSGFAAEVILRHQDKKQKCRCWDYVNSSGDTQCPRCRGKGFLLFDRRIRAVKKKFIGSEEIAELGRLHFDSALFYFKYDSLITEGDIIREAMVDDKGKISSPVRILTNHIIRDVEYYKGNMGRIEFIGCYFNKSE